MRFGILISIYFFVFILGAQDSLVFNNIINIPCNPVESQGKTGTCWSYATASFLESELIRVGKGSINLSEMFVARNVYLEKADNYIRRHGKTNFGEGSLSHDLINTINKYGLMPNSVYDGFVLNSTKHNHSEMSSILKSYVKAVVENKKPSKLWKRGYSAILDVYLGDIPTSFKFKGRNYTPQSFAEYLDINSDDYINLTSFTHHPFYDNFILEVPDNWSNGTFYNLPINDLLDVAKNALNNGYTIAWDTDVSGDGFDAKKGIADEKETATQELRQERFNNYIVTDDHLMHITGLVKGSDDKFYFLVKNSWGKELGLEDYKGYILASENYFKLNSISIMVHKDAIPKKIFKKLF